MSELQNGEIIFFLNRKKDKDCDNCGRTIKKSERVVSRLVVKDIPHAIVSYVCRRCN